MDDTLVSICVLSYNSAETIVETLESIKAQTYKNIELIVGDDCSSDDTITVVKKWIENNVNDFVRTQLIVAEANTGVPANCNRVVHASKGEWVKIIAGDDVLLPKCIELNLNFAKINKAVILFSKSENFNSTTNEIMGYRPVKPLFLPKNAKDQFNLFIIKDFVNPPTVFYKKELIEEVGYYNCKYKYMEDSPMWYKVLKHGTPLYYMDEVTVKYRISGTSLSSSKRKGKPNANWISSSYAFYKDCIRKELISENKRFCVFLKDMDYYLKIKLQKIDNLALLYIIKAILSIQNRIYSKLYL